MGVGLQHLCLDANSSSVVWWQQARVEVPSIFRRGFDALAFLVSWEVWKERNRRTFDGVAISPAALLVGIRDEAVAWVMAGMRGLSALLAHQG